MDESNLPQDQADAASSPPVRTPDNTPIPNGRGGRWTWDEAARDWVSLDPAPEEAKEA